MSKAIDGYRFKDGRPIHDGDCWFWSVKVCTCGLLHKAQRDEPFGSDWLCEERAEQMKVYNRLLNLVPAIESEPCLSNQTGKADTPS